MRVLLITSRYPLPPWRGNQVRTVEWLRALAEHKVRLICPRSDDDRPGSLPAEIEYTQGSIRSKGVGFLRALVSGRPLQEGIYESESARTAVKSAVCDWRPDVVVVQMVRCAWAAEVVRGAGPSVPLVFDAIDAMGLHFQRAADLASPLLRMAFRFEATRCRHLEKLMVESADLSTAVAQRDLVALGTPPNRGHVVPVSGREIPLREAPPASPVIVLSGNLGYRPTVLGALRFASEVWPRVRERVPDVRWIVAGARPVRSVQRLAELPGVEVRADVSDLAPILAAATVSIAPMSGGSGVPMKVLEAMAGAIPVVANPWAADGLEDPAAVAIADTPDEWVSVLSRLFQDAAVAKELGDRGHALWKSRYNARRIANDICCVVEEAATIRR